MDIIIITLEKECNALKKKRDALNDKMEKDTLGEVIRMRIVFQKLAKKHGIMSKECQDYAKKNGDKEKELMDLSGWQNKNMLSNMDKLFEMDKNIGQLSNKICTEKMKYERYK